MKRLKAFYGYLLKKPSYILMIGLTTIIFIGWLDYETGYEIGLSPLYLFPIFFMAWNLCLAYGILAGVVSAVVWFLAEILAKGAATNYFVSIWNSGVRLIIFLIVAYTTWLIRVTRNRQKELTDFIVHDLRAPLTNLAEGLSLLREYEVDRLSEQQRSLVASCSISCRRANTLVTSILDISRLEAGKMDIDKNTERTKDLLDISMQEVSVWAKKNRVFLKLEHDSQKESIYTDKNLLIRIMVNLLSNAIKVSPPETMIVVRLFDYNEENIAVSIHDEGPGIPKNMRDKVFDKFEQLKAKKTGSFVGSGIGLTFCKMGIEKLGGNIWVESAEGKGAEIVFTLPIKKEPSDYE